MVNYWNRAQPEAGDVENTASQISSAKYGAKVYFISGIILGALMVWGWNQFWAFEGAEVSFFRYLWLCVTHYDGSIPAFLKSSQMDDKEDVGDLDTGTRWYSKLIF